MSINTVNVSGNLTRDPQVRSTQSGTTILTLGLAVNDRRKNPQTGEWEDHPNFVDCVMYGKRAESVSRFLAKGAKVAIEGKLRYSTWEKDGQKRSKLEVVVDEIEFMSQRHGEAQNGARHSQANNYTNQRQSGPYSDPQQPQTGYQQPTGYHMDLSDEPIPF